MRDDDNDSGDEDDYIFSSIIIAIYVIYCDYKLFLDLCLLLWCLVMTFPGAASSCCLRIRIKVLGLELVHFMSLVHKWKKTP